ncbi:RNA-directed RNA polymerase [Enterobacteria phage FrSangria]
MSKTASSHNSPSAQLRRAANTRIEVEGNLALSIANDLLLAYGQSPFSSEAECISFSPRFDGTPDDFRINYLKAEIMSKYGDFSLGIDTEAAAWEKFLAAEAECALTNARLYRPDYSEDFNFSLGESCIHMARRKIAKLIGDAPSIEGMLRHCRFSGGATTTNNRSYGHPSFKFALPQACTPRALKYVLALRASTHFDIRVSDISPFNKAVTVPKNSKTDRCIAIEPGWNMFFQLGVGGILRDRLRCWGIDLNDQTINQRRAHEGSVTNNLATVDLSAASDSISLALCELLLPPGWFEVLMDLRSPKGRLPDGSVVTYEKISSMGNGYTFELESLIFASLARSVCEILDLDSSEVTVYGDDIILPSCAVPALQEVFKYVGFTTNTKKTFSEGPFRESCGKHYYSGVDVTPFYIRHRIVSPADLILVLNNLYRWATIDGVWDPRAYSVYLKYRKLLPKQLQRNTIPDGYGDGALVGSVLINPFAKNRGWIRYVPVIIDHTRDRERVESGSYLYDLFSRCFSESNDGLPLRGPSSCDSVNLLAIDQLICRSNPTKISRSTGKFDIQYIACSSRVLAPYGVFQGTKVTSLHEV